MVIILGKLNKIELLLTASTISDSNFIEDNQGLYVYMFYSHLLKTYTFMVGIPKYQQ